MVKLLTYIDRCVAAARCQNSAKGSRFTGYSQCRASLSTMAGIEQMGVDSLADPDFAVRYGRWLFGGGYAQACGADKSVATLANHFENFMTLARYAAHDGYIPAVDIFSEARGRLAKEFPEHFAKATKTKGFVGHPFMTNFDRLRTCVSRDLSNRNKAASAFPAVVYIVGLSLGGLEIERTLELEEDAPELINSPGRRHVEALLQVVNGAKNSAGFLLARPKAWSDAKSEKLTIALKAYLQQNNIMLMMGGSIFLDWLGMCFEHGVGQSIVIKAIKMGISALKMPELASATRNIADDRGIISRRWYILRSYSPSLKNDVLKEHVGNALDKAGIPFSVSRDLYDPHDVRKREQRGKVIVYNNPVVSNLLFVRTSRAGAVAVNAYRRDASLMRRPGDTEFAVVSHSTIVDMITLLRDYREGLEITGIEWAKKREDANAPYAPGVRVRILTGPFKGLEATVDQIVKHTAGADPDSRLYRLTLPQFPTPTTATLPALSLVSETTNV